MDRFQTRSQASYISPQIKIDLTKQQAYMLLLRAATIKQTNPAKEGAGTITV